MSHLPTASDGVLPKLNLTVVAAVCVVVLWDVAFLLGVRAATLGPLPARSLQGAIAVFAALLLVGRAALAGPRYVAVALPGVPLALLYAFTGRLLPWDQLSFWLAQSVLEALLFVPVVGRLGARLLFGGFTVSPATLELAWTYHHGIAALMAIVVVAVLGVHGYRLARTTAVEDRVTSAE